MLGLDWIDNSKQYALNNGIGRNDFVHAVVTVILLQSGMVVALPPWNWIVNRANRPVSDLATIAPVSVVHRPNDGWATN
eukprot:scaffold300091_cov59-Attheya_sp.AAC.1